MNSASFRGIFTDYCSILHRNGRFTIAPLARHGLQAKAVLGTPRIGILPPIWPRHTNGGRSPRQLVLTKVRYIRNLSAMMKCYPPIDIERLNLMDCLGGSSPLRSWMQVDARRQIYAYALHAHPSLFASDDSVRQTAQLRIVTYNTAGEAYCQVAARIVSTLCSKRSGRRSATTASRVATTPPTDSPSRSMFSCCRSKICRRTVRASIIPRPRHSQFSRS